MTDAQMAQYVGDQLRYNAYELRNKRKAAIKHYGVRVEVTPDLKKCYVLGRLVVCLPQTHIFRYEFNCAMRNVLDTLIAVQAAIEY